MEISRFWDGLTIGDATVAPYDAGTEFSQVMTAVSGAAQYVDKGGVVRSPDGEFATSTPNLGQIRVGPGEGLCYGCWYSSDADVDHTIPIPAAAARIDLIILRKDWAAQTVRQILVTGAEGGGAPALQHDAGNIWETALYSINVAVDGTFTIDDVREFLGAPSMSGIVITDPIVSRCIMFAPPASTVPDTFLCREDAGQLLITLAGSSSGVLIGQAVPAGAGTPRGDICVNARYTGGAWVLPDATSPGTLLLIGSAAAPASNLFGLYDIDTAAASVPTAKFSIQRSGIVHATNTVNIPATFGLGLGNGSGYLICDAVGNMQYGATAAHMFSAGGRTVYWTAGFFYPTDNAASYCGIAGSNEWFEICANTWHTAGSAVVNPGSAYFHPVNSTVHDGHPGIPWAAGYWGAGTFSGALGVSGLITTTGGITGNGGVFPISAVANIQLAPTGTIVHPSGNLNCMLGTLNLEWNTVYTPHVYCGNAVGNLNIDCAGGVQLLAHGAGAGIHMITDTGQQLMGTGAGYAVMPQIDNHTGLGAFANRWVAGYGVNGWNANSTREVKENWEDLPQGLALRALRSVQFGRFDYKRSPAIGDWEPEWQKHNRHTVGYIAEDTIERTRECGAEDLFVSRTGRDVEPQRTASVIGAAVQDLDRELREQIADLVKRLTTLEGKKNGRS